MVIVIIFNIVVVVMEAYSNLMCFHVKRDFQFLKSNPSHQLINSLKKLSKNSQKKFKKFVLDRPVLMDFFNLKKPK